MVAVFGTITYGNVCRQLNETPEGIDEVNESLESNDENLTINRLLKKTTEIATKDKDKNG